VPDAALPARHCRWNELDHAGIRDGGSKGYLPRSGTRTVGDRDQFRYTTMRDFEGDGDLAGIMDARAFLPEECRLAGRSTGTSKTLTPAWLR
jgi:hypothetical protein